MIHPARSTSTAEHHIALIRFLDVYLILINENIKSDREKKIKKSINGKARKLNGCQPMNVTKRKAREMEKKRKIPKNGRYAEIKTTIYYRSHTRT